MRYMTMVPLSGVADTILERVMPVYSEEIARAQPWLYAKGRAAGQAAMAAIKDKIITPREPPPPSSMPVWLPQVIDPVLNPFLNGFKAEIKPVATKVIAGAATAVVGAAAGTFLLGLIIGRFTGR